MPLSKCSRRAWKIVVLVFVGVILLELVSYTALSLRLKRVVSYAVMDQVASRYGAMGGFSVEQEEGGLKTDPLRVPHPYVGYVHKKNQRVFEDALKDIQSFSGVTIGIFGGSFAQQFASQGMASLRASLASAPSFEGKDIRVFSFGLEGYKQPQQLMALSYVRALGGELDIVLNLDGFNEVVVPPRDNIPFEVSPFYPRNWWAQMPIAGTELHLEQFTSLAQKRSIQAFRVRKTPRRYSFTAFLIWHRSDSRIANKLIQLKNEMRVHEPIDSAAGEQLLNDLVGIWQRSSLAMHALVETSGALYVHMLQPNQYVEGSKPMGTSERAIAIREGHPYKEWVERGYPILRQRGESLRSIGVRFHDLTMTFADIEDPLYVDDCCHLSQRGYSLLGQTIGRIIGEEFGN